VLRLASSGVVDLLAAGDAGGDDLDIAGGGAHRGRETALGDGERDVVVLLFEAEGARHTATARIDFRHLVPRPLQHVDGRRRADESFLMAVAVKQGLFAVAAEM